MKRSVYEDRFEESNYKRLYAIFASAYKEDLPPHIWYEQTIKCKLDKEGEDI